MTTSLRGRTWAFALVLALAVAACATRRPTLLQIHQVEQSWNELSHERTARLDASQDVTDVEAKLSALATTAAEAARAQADPKAAVHFWHYAALAAGHGGRTGLAQLNPIVSKGKQACSGLQPPDLAAPRDCMLISLMDERSVYAPIEANVRALEAKQKPLPEADGVDIVRWFGDLEKSFNEIGALKQRYSASSVDALSFDMLERDRAKVFCAARDDIALLARVGDNTADDVVPFSARRTAMRDALPPQLAASPCGRVQ